MRILLLSAYDTDSHKSWCQGLMSHCLQFQWTYLVLPGRYFSWRIRGNPLSWAFGEQRAILEQEYDLILATSMVDLATLKGLVPNLAQIPTVLYMHENQFAYPTSDEQHKSIEPQMVNLYSALTADHVLFNSHYNRLSMIEGAGKLLQKMPDFAPLSAIEKIKQQSSVLPVPIQAPQSPSGKKETNQAPLSVIWNHRWEYDKGPEVLMHLVQMCSEKNAPIIFSIAGNRFRSIPSALQSLIDGKYPCVQHIGTFPERKDYEKALAEHDVVLSTAHHEFQGLAMLEGCSHGCIPLAPNDLAYPEWVPDGCLYATSKDPATQAKTAMESLLNWQSEGLPNVPDVTPYYWQNLAKEYALQLLKIREEYPA